jgi:Ca2+-binding RTX toxin-like protein
MLTSIERLDLELGTTNYIIVGGALNDIVVGAMSGTHKLSGGAGNDKLSGGNFDDSLDGGDGDDWLDVGGGSNSVQGGLGDDTIVSGDGKFAASLLDTIDGGTGFDLAVLHRETFNMALTVTTSGGGGGLDIGDGTRLSGIEGLEVFAGFGNDKLTGGLAQVQFASIGVGLAISNADFFVF